ncbi:hypothetical protein GP486_007032, partial [Trichoglossum hirsutum]
FVTGLTDEALRGAFHRTMYKVARHLGLSPALVELRHAATHQKLLSLPVLRKAAQRSLEWLWNNYWVKIDKNESRETDTDVDRSSEVEECKDLFRHILRSYKQSRVMQAKQEMPFDESETIETSRRIQGICCGHADKTSVLVNILLEARFIIPDGRRLEDGAPLDIGFALWNDILTLLSNSMASTFLPTLLERLFDDLGKQPKMSIHGDSTRKDNMYLWISHILSSHEWEKTLSIVNIDLESVLQKCLMDPNDWTLKVASHIFTTDKRLEDNYAELAHLAQIQLETNFELPKFLMWRRGQHDQNQIEDVETQLISEVQEEVRGYEANCLKLKMLLDETPSHEHVVEEDSDVVSLMSEDSPDDEDEQEVTVSPSKFPHENHTIKGWMRFDGQWTPKPIGAV